MRSAEPTSPVRSLGKNPSTAALILSSLAGGDKHGYALVKDVEAFADVHIAPGTLYEALARLESQNFIEALESDDRRRPYRLTAVGAAALSNHLSSQQRVVSTGLRRLKTGWSVSVGWSVA
jgi:DNA-binding PadR family transcriptional regulator